MDCCGYSKLWNLNEYSVRVNRDSTALRSVAYIVDLNFVNIAPNLAGTNLCCTCNTYELSHANKDFELEVNSFLHPSVYLFVNGKEAETNKPKLVYWRRRYLIIFLVSLLLIGLSVGVFVPLRVAWNEQRRLRGLYWFLVAMMIVGAYLFLVSAVGLVRYCLLYTPSNAAKKQKGSTNGV